MPSHRDVLARGGGAGQGGYSYSLEAYYARMFAFHVERSCWARTSPIGLGHGSAQLNAEISLQSDSVTSFVRELVVAIPLVYIPCEAGQYVARSTWNDLRRIWIGCFVLIWLDTLGPVLGLCPPLM